MQRELSSLDIYVIATELQDLIGSYIEKIYQPSRSEILIKVKKSKNAIKEAIFIRNQELICRTHKTIQTPQKPSTFAMTLRKFLINGKIIDIDRAAFDC